MWKSYFVWRKNVRSSRMASSQLVLSNNLFILNDNVRHSILRMRDICNEISKLRLHNIARHTHTMDQFLGAQLEHKEKIQEKLEGYFKQLKAVVLEACENSLQAHGFLTDRDYN